MTSRTKVLKQRLLNEFQRDFPLSRTPFQEIAERLMVTEAEVLTAFDELHDDFTVSRIGSIIPPNTVGASLLAAMSVPIDQLEDIALWINRFSEVNHNYEREHTYNLWFVVTGHSVDHLESVLSQIEARTQCPVLRLPLLEEYYIDLGFPIDFRAIL